MNLNRCIKNLEKRRIVSKAPHPLLPFMLAAFSYIIGMQIYEKSAAFGRAFYSLAIFTAIFAIIHLIVYKILASR